MEVIDSFVGVDTAQSVDSGVDMRQHRRHWLQLEALQTLDADTEHGVDEHERGTSDRNY